MPNIIEITDFSAPELDIYARLSETQLLHYYEPDTGIFIAESPKVVERALDAGYEPISLLLERKHFLIIVKEDIIVLTVENIFTRLFPCFLSIVALLLDWHFILYIYLATDKVFAL